MAARIFLLIAVVYTIIISTLSLVPLGKISVGGFNPTDKMLHGVAYFILTLLWLFYYLMKKSGILNYKWKFFNISTLVIVFGMLIEVLQGALTSYRQPDWADILANSLGVLVGFLFCAVFLNFLKRIKQKFNLFL
ncbi:MAG TPA: VanZ family protein [Gillisia sp.]|nr:VanZ family protein [Gillisia sp.]